MLPPLLDAGVLEKLRSELEYDEGIWLTFLRSYIGELARRNGRLRLALTSGDSAGAMDATLSLRTSSEMVGAERLAAIAVDLQRSLRETAPDDAAIVLPRLAATYLTRLKRCSQQTREHLQKHLTI